MGDMVLMSMSMRYSTNNLMKYFTLASLILSEYALKIKFKKYDQGQGVKKCRTPF